MRNSIPLTLTGILLAFALVPGASAGERGGRLTLRVQANPSSFDAAQSSLGGPGQAFYIGGVICEDPTLGAPCTPIGDFHCWGWMVDPSDPSAVTVVSQEFSLDGRGKLQVQGVEDEGPRAVVGGTGRFRNVRGEATGFDFSELVTLGEFTGTFKLIGARHGHDD